jgi:hypothetical protein
MFLSEYKCSKCLGRVWCDWDRKQILIQDFMRENAFLLTCITGTSVCPLGTGRAWSSGHGGTSVPTFGATVPTLRCIESPIFHLLKELVSIPMDPKHLNLIN